MDYTCILTSQLENQRLYFEEKLRDAEERSNEYGRSMQQKVTTHPDNNF